MTPRLSDKHHHRHDSSVNTIYSTGKVASSHASYCEANQCLMEIFKRKHCKQYIKVHGIEEIKQC